MISSDAKVKAIDAIVYGDAFDCAVSFEEVHKYSRLRIDEEPLKDLLQDLLTAGVIEEGDGYFCLPGRRELTRDRRQSVERSARLLKRAQRVARCLRHLPFVRDLYLTGSVAAHNAESNADVDLLIVVGSERLGMVFTLLGPLSRVLSRQVFCPNYYVSENHLALDQRSHYMAREVLQARPLLGERNPLLRDNQWVGKALPNAPSTANETGFARRSGAQRAMEWLLGGKVGESLESRGRQLALKRLEAHYEGRGQAVPANVEGQLQKGEALRFHANQRVQAAESSHQRKTEALLDVLEGLEARAAESARA